MSNITTKILVDEVAKHTSVKKKDILDIVTATFNQIANGLKQSKKVSINNFGTFKAQPYAAKKGRNPKTGADIQIPSGVRAKFAPAKNLKEQL
tara:strand:+ start:233 stop:511 length:279 start_codon:yes stop_codon:yes gene_type:complete